jgi:hypothetical protein
MTTAANPLWPHDVKDFIGRPYGYLVVIAYAGLRRFPSSKQNVSLWNCRCSCGREKVILRTSLTSGRSTSCGCRGRMRGQSRLRQAYPAEFHIWKGMWGRCTNPRNDAYPGYGGAGVSVTPAWRSFDQFLQDNGPRPSRAYSLDRFPNPRGHYEPGNTRWATMPQQCRNTRRNHWLTYQGKTLCMKDWASTLGISSSGFRWRIAHQWPEDALFSAVVMTKAEAAANARAAKIHRHTGAGSPPMR